MNLFSPVEICPNLEPGVRIGDGWITIAYSDRPGDCGRTRYRYTIIRKDRPDLVYEDLQSGVGVSRGLRDGLLSLLAFLADAADGCRYYTMQGKEDPDPVGWPDDLCEWLYLHSEDLEYVSMSVDDNMTCIQE